MKLDLIEPQILKGVAIKNGDGWKDSTVKGDVVFVYNKEMPSPYSPGQYPRVGFSNWTASTDMFDFSPADVEEFASYLEKRLR